MRTKKAAMEMSVGTIVTIVLLMTVLILGLVLVRGIFSSSIENIDSIDQNVKNEINKLFTEDSSRQIVIYPPTREIAIKKGETGGFGFSIRNTMQDNRAFSYTVTESENSCGMSESEAEDLIILGKSGDGINIGSGNVLDNPILVKFDISENTPLCNIRYNLDVEYLDENNQKKQYGNTVSIDLEIKPE